MNERRPLSNPETAMLEIFITAAQTAAADWVGAELAVVEQFVERVHHWNEDLLIASLPLRPALSSGPSLAPSRLMLAMDEAAGARFAERAFAEVDVVPDRSLLRVCIPGFADLVAGRAKALTLGSSAHFLLGTPKLELPEIGRSWATAILGTDFGDIYLHLDLDQRG